MPTDSFGNTSTERTPYFFADKNSVDQTPFVTGVWTKLTFTNVFVNYGGYWDAVNSRLIPPPGPWYILCTTTINPTNVTDQMNANFAMLRNGDTADPADRGTITLASAAGNAFSVSMIAPIVSTGNDYWEAWLQLQGVGNKSIWGVPVYTYIQGISLG